MNYCPNSSQLTDWCYIILHVILHILSVAGVVSPFYVFGCCLTLSVTLQLDKGDYQKNLHAALCPNKYRYFNSFNHLDLVVVPSIILLKVSIIWIS